MESTKSAALCEYTVFIRRIFFLSGLYYQHENATARSVHRIFAYLLLFGCYYITTYILCHIIYYLKFSAIYASYVIILAWQIQSCIAMTFFIRWQDTGVLKEISEHLKNGSISILKVARKITVASTLFLVSCIALTVGVTVMIRLTGREGTFFNIQTVNAFIHPKLSPFMLFFGAFMSAAYIMVISIVAGQALFMVAELRQLNKSLQQVGYDTMNDETLETTLRTHFERHLVISSRIRYLSETFSKFGLAMFITNIPLLTFTFFTLFVRARVKFLDALLTSPEVILGFVKIIYLLYIPSKIQTEASKTYVNLCSNPRLWQKLNRRVYELASIFIAHANQNDLGMQIFGMTTISKPFLLTGASVITTALTFLIQSKFPCLAKYNATANSTSFMSNH
ncbi:hypothetical protein M3Y95_00950300 [Aphelenchoides besseyi]|nr:hypothetical protein M3Y95_00950300 [Aphelenchoides besseyi]